MPRTRPGNAVFLSLGLVACGGGGGGALTTGACPVGQTPVTVEVDGEAATLCMGAPPAVVDGESYPRLALPEYLDGPPLLSDEPVLDGCGDTAEGRWPRGDAARTGSTATVTLQGLVTKFGAGARPAGATAVCVAVLDFDLLLDSACVKGGPEGWDDCLAADPCAGPGAVGPGVVLGKDADGRVGVGVTSTPAEGNDEAGWYEIREVPVERNLVLRVSGQSVLWKPTLKHGLWIPAWQSGLPAVEMEASVISASSWQTVPPAAKVPAGVQDGNGVIAGTVADCGAPPALGASCDLARSCAPGAECECSTAGEPSPGWACAPDEELQGHCTRLPWTVVGATVGLSREATNIAYFQGNEEDNVPQPGRRFTNLLGTYAVIDLPAGEVTVFALVSGAGAARALGTARILVAPGSVSILSFRGGWTGHFPWYL